jgi:hypothetical protein
MLYNINTHKSGIWHSAKQEGKEVKLIIINNLFYMLECEKTKKGE